ncbi:MAG TPA: hypothetical protein VJ650_18240 [Gemmatimonadaceae bacterium]|nr:hypothetical protein [Gemmatimonadaceae bacterium]
MAKPDFGFSAAVVASSAALALLAACDDPLSPRDVAGTYVLRSVRGTPVPAVFQEAEQSRLHVLADTLRLHADGTGMETWLLQSTGVHAWGPDRRQRSLRFEIRRGRIEATYLCGPAENCAHVVGLRGQLSGSELRADPHLYGAGPVVFERVGS